MKTAGRSHGFSLLELLVVIGILAVLLAVLFPTIGSIRRAARVTACASNLKQLGQALLAYKSERRQWPCVKPALFERSTRGVDAAKLPEDLSRLARAPFLRDALAGFVSPGSDVYRCPGDGDGAVATQLGTGSSYLESPVLRGYRERREPIWNFLLQDFIGVIGFNIGEGIPDPQLHPKPIRGNLLRTDGSVETFNAK